MGPEPTDDALPLPGLEQLGTQQAAMAGDLAVAVRRSIRALYGEGLVREVDAARLQLSLELADIITIKKRTGKMSTVGNDARVLVDLLEQLQPDATETDDALATAIAQWNQLEADGKLEAADPEQRAP